MKLVKDIAPGDYLRGHVKECEVCREMFIGRDDARFCSSKCRKAAHARKKS